MNVPRQRRAGQDGFPPSEVLAATALFAVLGTMLFQMVQGGMELWSRGERVRDGEERAAAVLDLLTEDLRHVWSGPGGDGEQPARFLVEWLTQDLDADGLTDRRTSVLRFARLSHEERSIAWLRRAGERPGAQQAVTLQGDEDPAELLPTGGLAESLYATLWLEGDALPSLVRRVRMPLGGSGSLLEADLAARADRLGAGALLLADRVLHFGVLCWTPESTVWEAARPEDGVPASRTWDSTRGLLGPDADGFRHAVGPESLLDGRDDLFPPAVLLELVLDPFSDEGRAPGSLAQPLTAEADRLTLTRASLGGDERLPEHIWIDGEWLGVTAKDGAVLRVTRGRRGTVPASHPTGAAVRVGQRFQRVVQLPAAREGLGR